MKDLNDEMWHYFNNLLREMSLEYHTHVTEDTYRQIEKILSTVAHHLMAIVEAQFTKEGYTSDDE